MPLFGLTNATDHASPYVWVVVLWAHALIGVMATAVAATWVDPALFAVGLAAVYFLSWECGVQRLRAGVLDALVDTAGVLAGGVIAAGAWAHWLPIIAATVAAFLGLTGVGAWRRAEAH